MRPWRFPKAGKLSLRIEDGGRLVLPNYLAPGPAHAHRRGGGYPRSGGMVSARPAAADREFLMVSGTAFDELKRWCAAHEVQVVGRYDAWADLLEPFLDTQLDAAETQATYARLARHGFDRREVDALRAEVEKPMMRLTAMTWEWVHYGMYDVLRATHPLLPFVGRARRRAFVQRVMAVAERGCAAS